MIQKLKEVIVTNKKLFSDMVLISLASVASSFLSYYLNFYVQSLYTDVIDFKNFTIFITFLSLIILIPNTFGTSIIIQVTELTTLKKTSQLFDLFWKLLGIFLLIGLIVLLIVNYFSKNLEFLFQVNVNNFFNLTSWYLLLMIIGIPIQAFIYGMMKFKAHVFLIISTIVVKIVGISYFFSLGYGFYAVFYGFIISGLYSIIFGLVSIFINLNLRVEKISSKDLIKKIFLFSVPILFISLGRDLLTYLDFLVVSSRFTQIEASKYALLMNLGKIFLFGSLIILGVMMPQIIDSFNRGENYFKKFKLYLFMETFIVTIGLIIFSVFPKYVIDGLILLTSFLGLSSGSLNSYYDVLSYLPLYSFFIALLVMINLFTIFLISIKRLSIFIFYIVTVLLQFLGASFFAKNIEQVIFCNIICSGLLLLYLIYVTQKKYEDFNNNSSL